MRINIRKNTRSKKRKNAPLEKRMSDVEQVITGLVGNFNIAVNRLLSLEQMINSNSDSEPSPAEMEELINESGMPEALKKAVQISQETEKISASAIECIKEAEEDMGDSLLEVGKRMYRVFWSVHPLEDVSPEVVRNLSDTWSETASGQLLNLMGVSLKPGWQTMIGIFEYPLHSLEDLLTFAQGIDNESTGDI